MLPDAPPAPRRPVRALVAAVGFGGVLAVGGWWAGRDLTSATQPVRAPLGGARLFDQVAAAVAQKYVDSLPADTIFAKSVAGMLNELDDPFTSFLPEERLRRLNEQMNGTFSGVGMQVDIRDGWPVVIEPLVGGPSERAGVLAGDRIVLIGKESTRDLDRDEVFKRLRGPSGTPVTFTVERESQRQTFTLVPELSARWIRW